MKVYAHAGLRDVRPQAVQRWLGSVVHKVIGERIGTIAMAIEVVAAMPDETRLSRPSPSMERGQPE